MEMRILTPEAENKYYIVEDAGGWNPCILGNPNNRPYPGSVLANCVGAGVGRFNEVARRNACDLLGNRYPGTMLALAREQGLEIWNTPAVGGLVCMVKADGVSGHVISVEKIEGNYIYTFESGWSYRPGVYISNRKITAAGNYGMDSRYRFAGCIVNPSIDPWPIPPKSFTTYYTKHGNYVKFVQWALNASGCYAPGSDNSIDGICGKATTEAIKEYQSRHNLEVDGWAGPLTCGEMAKEWSIL